MLHLFYSLWQIGFIYLEHCPVFGKYVVNAAVYMFHCLSVHQSVCLSVSLSVCPSLLIPVAVFGVILHTTVVRRFLVGGATRHRECMVSVCVVVEVKEIVRNC